MYKDHKIGVVVPAYNEELLIVHNIDIHGQLKIERDDFNYALDFGAIYRPVQCNRTFTRI